MGKAIISEGMFPEIVRHYNASGKMAVYARLRDRYGIKQPGSVIARIKKSGKYGYNPDTDQFSGADTDAGESLFLCLDELCGKTSVAVERTGKTVTDTRPAAMEKLVRELLSDRLLVLSHYITMDSSKRIVFFDRSSMETDGYRLVIH